MLREQEIILEKGLKDKNLGADILWNRSSKEDKPLSSRDCLKLDDSLDIINS